MAQIGTGKYTYELVRDFCKLPAGETSGWSAGWRPLRGASNPC
jgi:hypothetical protein